MKLPLFAILIASILLVSAASLTPRANSAEGTAQAAQKNKTEVQAATLLVSRANPDGSVARSWFDYVLPILTALLVVVTWAQARLLYWTYIADHRPRLVIRHVALASEPDDLLAVSPRGTTEVKPLEVVLVLTNRGGSDARIIEGNMTLQVYGRDTIEKIVRGAKNVLLPPFDKKTGLPAYSSDREAFQGEARRQASSQTEHGRP